MNSLLKKPSLLLLVMVMITKPGESEMKIRGVSSKAKAGGGAAAQESSLTERPVEVGLSDDDFSDLEMTSTHAVGRSWGQSLREAWLGKSKAVITEISAGYFDTKHRVNAANRLNWALLDNINKERELTSKAYADLQRQFDELSRVRKQYLENTAVFLNCAESTKLEINAANDVYRHLRAARIAAMIQMYDHLKKSAEFFQELKREENKIKSIGRIERPSSPLESMDTLESIIARAKVYHESEDSKKKSEKKDQ
jgi:hypothetical protein